MNAPGELPVVCAGDGWVVIDKPAGLLSVPGIGPANQICVASYVQSLFPEATGPLIVHRLDMETSGLMVVALNSETHRKLSMAFEQRVIEKKYVGVVHGDVRGSGGVIELRHRVDLDNRPKQMIDPERGRLAITQWRVIGRNEAGADSDSVRTRLEFKLITGRTHQIRIACSAGQGLNAPLVGDSLYGVTGDESPRMLLHATSLIFTSPNNRQTVRTVSPPPF